MFYNFFPCTVLSPHIIVFVKFIKPKSDFSNTLGVSGYISLKNSPKW